MPETEVEISKMTEAAWLMQCSPAFRLMLATSWLAPERWREQQERGIRDAVGQGVDWAEYQRLVWRHRTPALSWSALKRTAGIDIPDRAKKELLRLSDACHLQAMQHALLLGEVLKGFEREGIGAMPMKGPILSLELYGEMGLRQARDLDVMVPPKEIARAQANLERMGWEADAGHRGMTPRQWQECVRHDRHIGYKRTQALGGVELHWRTLWESDVEAAQRWGRSTGAIWRGHAYRAMDPVDRVLYLCAHGSDHAWFRAKWLGDVARLHASAGVDWAACMSRAAQVGQERPVLLGLQLMEEAYELSWPGGVARQKMPGRLVARAIIDMHEPTEPEPVSAVRRLARRLRKAWYDRALWPETPWRKLLARLAYSFDDYRAFPLPDGFFWAYIPLRPALWVWRRLVRGGAPDG